MLWIGKTTLERAHTHTHTHTNTHTHTHTHTDMQADTYIGDRLSYLAGSLLGIDQATQAQALLEARGTQVAHFFIFLRACVRMSFGRESVTRRRVKLQIDLQCLSE